MVLGKLPVPGRPTIWITVGQGPTALAVGAGGGCLDIFTLIYPFFPLSPSLWETARYRLKYCLKGPLNPKSTNQPTISGRLPKGGRKRRNESKNVQTTPTRTYCKRSRPLPYCNLNSQSVGTKLHLLTTVGCFSSTLHKLKERFNSLDSFALSKFLCTGMWLCFKTFFDNISDTQQQDFSLKSC